MNIDYNDERFKNVEAEKQQELNNSNNFYNNMINESNAYYDNLMNATEQYGKQQQELQQQNTDFAIEKINQAQEQAQKDYLKEQKGAYTDYMKESNKYGANAEQMASSGLMNTGYSESSRVSMYNTYQNRVANARDTIKRANIEYSNQIKEAQLSNNSALAQIAYQTLENKLKLSLEGFQYKNNLLQAQESNRQTINNTYYNRYQDVLNQLVREKQFEEEQRQFNEQMALQKSKSSGSGGGSRGSGGGATINKDGVITDENGNFAGGLFLDGNTGYAISTDKDGNVKFNETELSKEKSNSKKSSSTKKSSSSNALGTGVKIGLAAANPTIAAKELVTNAVKKLFK